MPMPIARGRKGGAAGPDPVRNGTGTKDGKQKDGKSKVGNPFRIATSNGRSERGEGPANSTVELLGRYHRRRTVRLRDRLIERHRPIVENMARSLALRLPRCVDVQDLVHAGMWGLMQAIDKYEPGRGEHFLAFMRLRVRGAMLDELRNLDYLPRLCRRRQRTREKAIVRLRQQLSREPTEEELAGELEVSVETLRRLYGPAQVLGTEGQGGIREDGSDTMDRLADDDQESPIEAINRQELLDKIRDSLQPVEWKVLQMHYLEGMSGKEVARRLRLSASRICQIHGRVMDRLKVRLGSIAV